MRTQPTSKEFDKDKPQRLTAEERVKKAQRDLKKIQQKKFQAEAKALNIDSTKLYFARQKVAEINNNYDKGEQSLRTGVCNQEILLAFLHDDVPQLNYLAEYLKNCDLDTKKQDLNVALNLLKQSIDPDNKGIPDTDLGKYYTYLQKNKDSIPVEKLPQVTEITARAMFKMRVPEHNHNKSDGLNIFCGQQKIKEIYRYSWGKIIGGLLLSVFFGAGVPLVLAGLREKKFNEHASGLFKENKNLKRRNIDELFEDLKTEAPFHQKIPAYLNGRPEAELGNEMKDALASFKSYVDDLPQDNIFVKIYEQFAQLAKNISVNKLPALTESILRLLFLAKNPENSTNAPNSISDARSKYLANEIAPPVRSLFALKPKKSELCNLVDQAFSMRSQLINGRLLRGSINSFVC